MARQWRAGLCAVGKYLIYFAEMLIYKEVQVLFSAPFLRIVLYRDFSLQIKYFRILYSYSRLFF